MKIVSFFKEFNSVVIACPHHRKYLLLTKLSVQKLYQIVSEICEIDIDKRKLKQKCNVSEVCKIQAKENLRF